MRKIKIGNCFYDGGAVAIAVSEEYGSIDKDDDFCMVADVYTNASGKFRQPLSYLEEHSLPTLHLPIKGKWFEMILSGEKKEEYRDLKPFYSSRFGWHWDTPTINGAVFTPKHDFKVLHLTNGYGHDNPQLWAHIEEITIGKGNPEWGAPAEDVFIIRLGEVFHTKNVKP